MFFNPHRSYNFLSKINITRSLENLFSNFFLNNWLSNNRFLFNNSIIVLKNFNREISSINNRLNNRLINVFCCWYFYLCCFSGICNLWNFKNRFKCSINIIFFDKINLFSDFSDFWFYDGLLDNFITINCVKF